jgi:cyanophycinase
MSTYAFLGAGEFEDWHADVDRALFDGRVGKALVFATASAPEGDDVYDGWVAKGLDHYRALGIEVAAPPLRTAADAHDLGLAGELEDAALVFFSGGNPAYLASVLADSPFWRRLQERIAEGRTAYAGCSAGVACLCDPTFDSDTDDFDRIWAPGLGYFPQVLFAPHWDMVDTWIPGARAFIQAAAPADGHLIALDERTAMVGDGETWEVSGAGGVGVYRGGTWVGEHRNGASFALPLSPAAGGTAG